MDQKDNQQNPQPVNNFYGNINHYNVYHGPVSYNAPINNYNVEKEEEEEALDNNEEPPEDLEMKELKFFSMKKYGSEEKQQKLRGIIRYAATKIDVNNGRDWFCLYAAERYSEECLGSKQGYVYFFSDIEKLAPELLKKINEAETGYKRYKDYAELLSREADNWFVFNKCLPPINELMYQPKFGCDKDVFMRYSQVIKELNKQMG